MGMRRAMPLLDRASLIHTDRAMGISAIAAVTSVPAWQAFAVVTSTSICLRPQATCILHGRLPSLLFGYEVRLHMDGQSAAFASAEFLRQSHGLWILYGCTA